MSKYDFLVIQTDRYFKNVTVEADSLEQAQTELTDSMEGVDFSEDPSVRGHTSHKVKPLNQVASGELVAQQDHRKYYVVWVGHVPGVYDTWAECQKQTNGFRKARFKSFIGLANAKLAFEQGPPEPPSSAAVPEVLVMTPTEENEENAEYEDSDVF